MGGVGVPDAVGHDLVKAEVQFCSPPAQGVQELGVQEGLPAREAEGAYSLGMGVLKEAHGRGNVESIGPFDRHAAVWTGQVALVSASEGEVIGAKGAGAAADRPALAATAGRKSSGHADCSDWGDRSQGMDGKNLP